MSAVATSGSRRAGGRGAGLPAAVAVAAGAGAGIDGPGWNGTPGRNANLAVMLYGAAAALLVWAMVTREWETPDLGEDAPKAMSLEVRRPVLLFGIPLVILAYIAFGGGEFTPVNLFLGLLALGYAIAGFYQSKPAGDRPRWWRRLPELARSRLHITPWMVLIVGVFVLALFFRFYRLDEVPGEMFSDHAEKLMDVSNVLDGQTPIFFPRNTGREAIQFYLTAAVAQLLGTGLAFLSLKIGTALLGFLTLPFIYLIGKEIGGKWVGLFALLLAAVGYWPNTIARIGLRFPLYPVFVAPALYFLIRGLRRQNRNDFIWSGIALGIGIARLQPDADRALCFCAPGLALPATPPGRPEAHAGAGGVWDPGDHRFHHLAAFSAVCPGNPRRIWTMLGCAHSRGWGQPRAHTRPRRCRSSSITCGEPGSCPSGMMVRSGCIPFPGGPG